MTDKAVDEEQLKAEESKARALAEQKRKQELLEEGKQNLQKEIDERNLKLEQMKCETAQQVERLRKERIDSAFLLWASKKKLTKRLSPSRVRFPTLRRKLIHYVHNSEI